MPIALSRKQRIHYRLEGNKGPYLVLYSPFLQTLQGWYRSNYVKHLQDNCRLILIDPLGQGRSDAPQKFEHYVIESRARDILDIMEELKVEKMHFLGLGIGAQVGFFMAAHFPKRVRSLIVAGAHPYPVTTELQKIQEWIQQLRTDGIVALLNSLKSRQSFSTEWELEVSQGMAGAYAMSLEAICQWDGIEGLLESVSIPTLLITETGEEKFLAIREAGRIMPRARYLILPQLKYEDGLLDAATIAPHLIEFIRKQHRPE